MANGEGTLTFCLGFVVALLICAIVQLSVLLERKTKEAKIAKESVDADKEKVEELEERCEPVCQPARSSEARGEERSPVQQKPDDKAWMEECRPLRTVHFTQFGKAFHIDADCMGLRSRNKDYPLMDRVPCKLCMPNFTKTDWD